MIRFLKVVGCFEKFVGWLGMVERPNPKKLHKILFFSSSDSLHLFHFLANHLKKNFLKTYLFPFLGG
jgi:hypothetical protein